MMEEWITRKSPEYRELQEKALAALDRIEAMIETLPSHLNAETYLTSEEVRNLFGLSQRSLQTYRDERIIPYTVLGGKFLYPMSEIAKILENESRQTDSAIRQGATDRPLLLSFSAQRLQLSDLLFGEKIPEVLPVNIVVFASRPKTDRYGYRNFMVNSSFQSVV